MLGNCPEVRHSDPAGGQLNAEWESWFMNFPVKWLSLDAMLSPVLMSYYEKNIRPRQAVCGVRCNSSQKTLWGEIRGTWLFPSAQVLRPAVHGGGHDAGSTNAHGDQGEKQAPSRAAMPGVRDGGTVADTPHRRKQVQQQRIKPDDLVRLLSLEVALGEWEEDAESSCGLLNLWNACAEIGILSKALSTLQEVWRSASNEEKEWIAVRACGGSWFGQEIPVPRLTHNMPNRVDRCKALGNAQVPAVVRLAWEMLAPKLQ
jgi:hypothetical protein